MSMLSRFLPQGDSPFQQPDPAPDVQHLPENALFGDEPLEDDLTADAIPCDTLAATLLLRSQFPPASPKDAVPFALRSQLYTIVNDRTIVDRELDMLRCISLHFSALSFKPAMKCSCS